MALTIASFASVCGQPVELVALRAALTVRQMLPKKAFVLNFYFLECKPYPHLFSSSIALFATRFGCVEAVLRSVRRVLPVVGRAVDLFCPFGPAFLCALSSVLGHEAYVFGRPSDYSS